MSRILYEVLGVPPGSTEKEIKFAYHELARSKHPDLGGSTGEFAEITYAGSVLCDPERREAYDKRLRLLYNACKTCDGRGITYKQISFTVSAPQRCTTCQGKGFYERA